MFDRFSLVNSLSKNIVNLTSDFSICNFSAQIQAKSTRLLTVSWSECFDIMLFDVNIILTEFIKLSS